MARTRSSIAQAGQTESGRLSLTGTPLSRLVVLACATGLLSACATTPQRPRMPVAEEAAGYRHHAKSYYAPPGPPQDPWGPYIEEASARFDVPGVWIRAVMMQESGGRLFDRNGQLTTSTPGAMGLMQLMPPTYDDMRVQYNLGDDAYDPHDNIMAGAAYIRQMYDIYGSPGFLAAYNDGPGSLNSYLRRGRNLPRETRRYVAHVGPQIAGIWPRNRSAADLLVTQHDPSAATMVAQNASETASVRAAWRHQAEAATYQADSQDMQVAEAPATSSSSVSAAWAARGVRSSPPVQMARADTGRTTASSADVSQAWAGRAPVQPIPVGRHLKAEPVLAVMTPRPGLQRQTARPVQSGNWAIQVGAFNTAVQATRAAAQAQNHGGTSLRGARSQISSVKSGRAHLYRARLVNLSHEGAVAACHKMGRDTPCVVVSPGSSF
ncbi:lytic transglycosylase domain-containing protein [Swaminathania salitolerans]|uniref:lytic transglycosylase domain-containing protein n=1 Tax=Swaminathania salitolerans TaxID=182838 RepID=UPI001FE68BF0|nr:lytic transglycosylase domain-containing protein [Swaminathania salitolerans]GBQ09883.1 murein transglycosylase [Swaminathania salitolerans LMG 21291]